MKKILSLLILAPLMAISQTVPADATALENIQITNNKTSLTATKVNVQDANGVINTIPKSDLVNIVEVNDVPSLPLVGNAGKIYVVKNLNKIYRWNGVYYSELSAQNNIVRMLLIPNTSLSGVGSIEQQICDYILALPAEQRTIAETDSKWNVVTIQHWFNVFKLPSGLLELDLQNNQLTTISYTNAEAWANAQPAFTNPCNVYFGNNINSITGINLESILLTKNCIIIH